MNAATTVLITGANRGLGLEFVRQYAADGARVLACARVPGTARVLLDLAAASAGKITVHPLDVASDASVAHLKQELTDQAIDILINNAGVYGGDRQSADDLDLGAWMRTLSVNTLGPFRVFQALRANLAKGRDKKAIAITSGMGSTTRHNGDALIYRSSKAALNNVMRGLSRAFEADKLIIVPIHPGWVKTDMGGANATLAPEESVASLRRVIARLTTADSGRYLNFDGSELPW